MSSKLLPDAIHTLLNQRFAGQASHTVIVIGAVGMMAVAALGFNINRFITVEPIPPKSQQVQAVEKALPKDVFTAAPAEFHRIWMPNADGKTVNYIEETIGDIRIRYDYKRSLVAMVNRNHYPNDADYQDLGQSREDMEYHDIKILEFSTLSTGALQYVEELRKDPNFAKNDRQAWLVQSSEHRRMPFGNIYTEKTFRLLDTRLGIAFDADPESSDLTFEYIRAGNGWNEKAFNAIKTAGNKLTRAAPAPSES